MRESISIFKRIPPWLQLGFALALLLSAHARADDSQNKTPNPEDNDFSPTPYTQYGAFNEDQDEDNETRFMQYGRLFGVSLGIGDEGAFGNRGSFWQGGFPMLDLKVHYWFDFQLALDLDVTNAPHTYQGNSSIGLVDVNTNRIGVDVKYYFDVRNVAAPISFINPYVLVGIGAFSKTETQEQNGGNTTSDTAVALDVGLGMEFVLKPRSTYIEVEGRLRNATFKDTNTNVYDTAPWNLPDLTGLFYTTTFSILFTW